jgi:hypothetical protein
MVITPFDLNLQTKSDTHYGADIPAGDEISYNVEMDTFSLQSITINPDSLLKTFHVEILNQDQIVFISRYNFEGNFELRFVHNASYTLRISNPKTLNLYVDITISTLILEKRVGSGYYYNSEDNWCWVVNIDSEQTKILSLKDVKEGNFQVEVSIIDDDGSVGFYLTDQNPSTNSKWYESSDYFSCITFASREVSIDKNQDWLVISSQDNKIHDLIIVFTYLGRDISTFEIVIIVAFFLAGISYIFLRVRKKKDKIKRYFDPDAKKRNLQRQIKLASQIDIRHEGGRYVYMPPDMIEPDLIRPTSEDYEEED